MTQSLGTPQQRRQPTGICTAAFPWFTGLRPVTSHVHLASLPRCVFSGLQPQMPLKGVAGASAGSCSVFLGLSQAYGSCTCY